MSRALMAEHFTGTPAEWQTRIDLLQSQFADHAALFENDKIWHDNKWQAACVACQAVGSHNAAECIEHKRKTKEALAFLQPHDGW